MALPAKSIKTYNELIDLVIKTPQNLRFDTLDSFAKKHNLTYDWVKKRAEVLSYAAHGGDYRKIPKSLRQDVHNVREALERGVLPSAAVREASDILLRKTPLIDIERLNRQFLTHDKKVLGTQGKLAERVEKTMDSMIKAGVHPVRAYNLAWSRLGRTLHHEIPKALQSKNVSKKIAGKVVEDLWTLSYQKAQANYHYTNAGLEYTRLLEKHLLGFQSSPTTLPYFMRERGIQPKSNSEKQEKFRNRLWSDHKNVKRFPRPGHERPFPRDVKSIAKGRYYDNRHGRLPPAHNPFDQKLLAIGKKLRAADTIWRSAKEFEEKKITPFVQMSKKRKRR